MGVKGVSDQITIKPCISDSAVKSDIEAALRRRATNESNGIKVAVNGSEKTLTGKAASWVESDAAGSAAWCTPGVSNVVDNITISYSTEFNSGQQTNITKLVDLASLVFNSD